ncbi:short-subunit dehydrogenase [Microcella putealis]|uniref:Short-subunit dehydrogenase n=1 Tax=Microcella putealis TaxID=337005 RepID=A0A4Q7LRL0_9MICO|nr:oxidoreductase [Microcella putealis]RZS56309.1 short-subunit dehydrogenase [Microcella putealis]TQM27205.1 short-subunit dehydrogenase [Microcella putealis]
MSAQNARVALVTGASSGIGEATVDRLLAQGFIVYAGARRVDRMAGIEQRGAHTLSLDVTDDQSMTDAVAQILTERNRIDVLVNNAGYGSYGSMEEVPLEEARRQFEVNVFGLARLTQLVLPSMRERRSGRIINVSSIAGRIYEPLGAWYHATKFAVEGLSDSLRLEVAPFGIDVTIIQPGPIRTEWNTIARESMTAISGEGPYADIARRMRATYEKIDGGRTAGTPEQVADAIVRAATARRPKTREAVPASAKTVVGARRLLSDRAMDRVTRRILLRG